LLLALLLPLAQLAAADHELSHLDASTKATAHFTHCDLCVAAAAVTGGGAAPAAFHFPLAAVPFEAHAPIARPVRATSRHLPFQSRAPPTLLH
jgi:hypothetical protein